VLVNYSLSDIAAAGPHMLTTGRGKGDSGQATFVGYQGRHKSRPDHILMTPNYHILLSTGIHLPTSDLLIIAVPQRVSKQNRMI
jgi:hypothetical protein